MHGSICYLRLPVSCNSFVATDGKNENGLKLKEDGLTFSSFNDN